MPDFTTGPATLPDVGELSYNDCVFSPLFQTDVSCVFVKDAANRTTKEIEYTITADGYVTLPDSEINVQNTLATLERLLSAPAGALKYTGRSIKIVVNAEGGDRDVAWGPLPEILEIVPLGGGRSAKIKWTVKTRVPPRVPKSTARLGPVLQFCYDTSVSYDEAGYSTLSLRGIVEIPMTRATQTDTAVTDTVDSFRNKFPGDLLKTIDLQRFRVIQREFNVSKDKRTMEFSVTAEELPWMAMPPDITVARGQFNFRPVQVGAGLCNWLCTLSCTYTVPKDKPRRLAWLAFLALLRERMKAGNVHAVVPAPNGNQNPAAVAGQAAVAGILPPLGITNAIARWRQTTQTGPRVDRSRKTWLVDFSGNEGLYLDSKTVTFSASWRLITVFSEILLATGMWRKVPSHNENAWATSVGAIQGASSWLGNRLDPNADVIVDFGY